MICLITESEETYCKGIDTFVTWCDEHFLLLNVKKTKELIFNFRKIKDPLQPIRIKNEEVEVVSTYKYLGVTIDDQLSWINHTNQVRSKINKRLYFLRTLNKFHVEEKIMALFYKSTIECTDLFSITGWGGNARQRDTDMIDRVIRKAEKITRINFDCFLHCTWLHVQKDI